jgi:peptidoglycan hydrolase-like protein with peptidoglycan-binding domain
MKFWVRFALLLVIVSGVPAAVKHKKASTVKTPVAKHAAADKSVKSSSKSGGRKVYTSRKKSSRKRTAVARQPARPVVPSSDRYREIQEALAKKGYLTTPPTGAWDQNAQDAMRKFQADQNLSVSGKLSSRSLIALGLGSPTAAVPPASSPAVPPKP